MDNFLQTIGAINDETRVKILNFINIHGNQNLKLMITLSLITAKANCKKI